MFLHKVCHEHITQSTNLFTSTRAAPSGRYARSLRYMLQRASERRVLPDNSPRRQSHEELHPEPRHTIANQSRSPTQLLTTPSAPHHQGLPFPPQHRVMGETPMLPGSVTLPSQQWYDPTQEYSDPEANAWATMELNTGAVAVNGMEAYMIPVGYV